jgi:hypothetical protein
MMRFDVNAQSLLTFLMVLGLGLPASAADLSKIPRTIAREPAYTGKPQYCLLVFGKDAATRIWLVRDGNTLYVDRKANGDLTAPENRVGGASEYSASTGPLREKDGTEHANLSIWNLSGSEDFRMRLGSDRTRMQFVGFGHMGRPSWGSKPENAPIIHFNGPRTLARYGPLTTLPRLQNEYPSRLYKLRLMLGTPGLGTGTFASYSDSCSQNLGPVQADIEYAVPHPPLLPLKQRLHLVHDG